MIVWPYGKSKQRHAPLGEGYLGMKTFENLINNNKLENIPFYLETPNELEGYKKEIEIIRKLKRG